MSSSGHRGVDSVNKFGGGPDMVVNCCGLRVGFLVKSPTSAS